MVEYVGRSGYAGGYQIVVGEDRVRVLKDGIPVTDQAVPRREGRSIGQFAAEAEELRVGWGRQPTGDEVIAIFDGARPQPSYVVNLIDPALSGWGDLPTIAASVAIAGTEQDSAGA